MADWVKVAQESEVPDGASLRVDCDGEPVALFNVGGRISALHDSCPHAGAPLSSGSLSGDLVTCAWHAWQYDVTSGECRTNRSAIVRRFEVKVENGEVFVSA